MTWACPTAMINTSQLVAISRADTISRATARRSCSASRMAPHRPRQAMGRARGARPPCRPMTPLALVAGSVALTLLVLEIGFRLAHVPVGTVEVADPTVLLELAPEVFARVHAEQPGSIGRQHRELGGKGADGFGSFVGIGPWHDGHQPVDQPHDDIGAVQQPDDEGGHPYEQYRPDRRGRSVERIEAS